jgi:hypothetical protein
VVEDEDEVERGWLLLLLEDLLANLALGGPKEHWVFELGELNSIRHLSTCGKGRAP